MNWIASVFIKLLIFLSVPLLKELILLKKIYVAISLILFFTVNILEQVYVRFSFLYFKSKRVSLEVYLTTLCYFSVMFNFVRTIALNTFETIHITHESCIILFSAILTLWNIRVYIYTLNNYDMLINIEISVDKNLSLKTILSVLYINLDYYYIRFGGGFNHSEIKSRDNIIKYISSLKNFFHSFGCDREVGIFNEVWNVQDLEVYYKSLELITSLKPICYDQ